MDLLLDLLLDRRRLGDFDLRVDLLEERLDRRLDRLRDLRFGDFGVFERRFALRLLLLLDTFTLRLLLLFSFSFRLLLFLDALGTLLLRFATRRDFFPLPELTLRRAGALGVRARRFDALREFFDALTFDALPELVLSFFDAFGVLLRRFDARREGLRLVLFFAVFRIPDLEPIVLLFGAFGVLARRLGVLARRLEALRRLALLFDAFGVRLRRAPRRRLLRLSTGVLCVVAARRLGAFGVRLLRVGAFLEEVREALRALLFTALGVRERRRRERLPAGVLEAVAARFLGALGVRARRWQTLWLAGELAAVRARLGALGERERRLEARRDDDLALRLLTGRGMLDRR